MQKKSNCEDAQEKAFEQFVTDQYLYNNREDFKDTANHTSGSRLVLEVEHDWTLDLVSNNDGDGVEVVSKWKFFVANASSWRHFNVLPAIELFVFGNGEIYSLALSWLFFGVMFSLERLEEIAF